MVSRGGDQHVVQLVLKVFGDTNVEKKLRNLPLTNQIIGIKNLTTPY